MHSFYVIEKHLKEVNCCAFSENYFVTCSGDKTIRVYSACDFKELPYSPIKEFRYGVNFVAFDKLGKYLASACNEGKALIFLLTDTEAKIIATFHHSGTNTAQVCSFSHDSNYLVSGSADGSIALWDIEKKKLIKEISGHPEGNVYAAAFTPCDAFLVTGSGLGDLRIWEIPSMQVTMQTQAHDEGLSSCGVSCLQFSSSYHSSTTDPNRTYLMASCGQDNKARIWLFQAQSKRLKSFHELSGHHAPVSSCAFSPDGSCLATSSFDKNVIIWDPIGGERLIELSGHDALVTSVAYSSDGHLASTSYDKKVIIWKTDIEPDDAVQPDSVPPPVEDQVLPPEAISPPPQLPPSSDSSYVTWSCDQVVSWLSEQVMLGQYASSFRDNAIDGAELGSLTSEVLQKDLGITPLGHRNKITRAINNLQKNSSASPPPATTMRGRQAPAKVDWRKVTKAPTSVQITDNRPSKSDDDIPDQYLCPISREIMKDPVIAADGFTYERSMIEEWFHKGNSLSPMSNEPLSSKKLLPNQTLKSLIVQYLEDQQSKVKKWVEHKVQAT